MNIPRFKNTLKIGFMLSVSLLLVGQSNSQDNDKQLEITTDLFKCLTEMANSDSGSYFVDNILGDLAARIEVANSESGGEYPAGSLVSLIPTEVMLKHQSGWNEETNDWEFFELNVSATGSEIISRGTTDVINRFGGNCFGCHQLARPEWDLICGSDHGCAPLPIDRATIMAIQDGDTSCMKENDDDL